MPLIVTMAYCSLLPLVKADWIIILTVLLKSWQAAADPNFDLFLTCLKSNVKIACIFESLTRLRPVGFLIGTMAVVLLLILLQLGF